MACTCVVSQHPYFVHSLSPRFRWVYCQLETLRHCLPPSVRGILDELPETLDETYARILTDINKANREHARRLLHCLTVAIRPLRVDELAEVLAVDFNAESRGVIPIVNPDWRWADQRQAILSTCSSLISIIDDGESQVVQFSHFSVKEFLTSKRLAGSHGDVSRYHILLEPAHTILALACLGVLLRLDDRVDKVGAKDIPLAEYAARHWVDHAKFEGVASRLRDTMEYFFDADKPHWAAWLRVYNIDNPWAWTTLDSRVPDASPLYYATLCGFHDLTKYLVVKHPELIIATGGHRITPLTAVLDGKHFRVAEFLHQHGADVNFRDAKERTALHGASREGLVDMALWLLNHGADVNAQKWDGWLSLHLAVYHGQLEIVQMLLEQNADINTHNKDGKVALHIAAQRCDSPDEIHVMQLLLDHGADANVPSRNNQRSTPLHVAATHGRFEAAQMLLEHNADINARNEDGKTALFLASRYSDRINVIRLLLDRGADVEARSNAGSDPLHVATWSGRLVAARDIGGSTPLHVASWAGRFEAVRILLEYNADIDARHENGRTALHVAAQCCDKPQPDRIHVMQLLLDQGADINARDNEGSTPLHLSSRLKSLLRPTMGAIEGTRLLIQHGASIDAENNKGETARQVALATGFHEMAELLGFATK